MSSDLMQEALALTADVETDDTTEATAVAEPAPDVTPEVTPDDAAEGTEAALDTPEGEAPAPDGAAAPEPAPVDPPPPATPFAFRAMGQPYEVPGTKWDAERRTITIEDDRGLMRLQQMLAQGREWEARGRQELVALRKEVQAVKTQTPAEVEQARQYITQFAELMTMPPEQLADFIVNARTNWPLMQAKAERAIAERMVEQARQAASGPEPDVEMVVEQARTGAAELVREMTANQPWATPDVVQALTEELQDVDALDRWVLRAAADMPEHGIRRGQYVAHWDTARKLVEKIARPYVDAHQRLSQAQQSATRTVQQTAKVAAQNAKTLAAVKKPAPAPKPPAPPSQPTPPKRLTRDDIIAEAFATYQSMKRAG